jgi:hypothetical protein
VRLAAAVPLSGTAVLAGPGRYRLQLDVAPSWARRVCRRSRCTGLALVVAAGRNRTTGWTDAAGGAALVLPGPRHARRLVVSVTPLARRARSLAMRRLVLPVG